MSLGGGCHCYGLDVVNEEMKSVQQSNCVGVRGFVTSHQLAQPPPSDKPTRMTVESIPTTHIITLLFNSL